MVARFALVRSTTGRYLLALLVLSLTVRLVPAYFVHGSFDVGSWELVIRKIRMGQNPYLTGKLNWPPLWPLLLVVTLWMEDTYGLPRDFSVKLIPCVADTAIAIVLFVWLLRACGSPVAAFRRSLWYALNPVAIAACSLQGQFESLPCLFSLLAILEIHRNRTGWSAVLSALWLGLGGMAKTWPIFLFPALVRDIRSWWLRGLYVLLAVTPAALSVYLLYLAAPDAITRHVLNYRSNTGHWGLTALNFCLSKGTAQIWSRVVLWILYAALPAVYAVTWRRGSPGQMSLLAILTFFVFTPGMGPHYLTWILAAAILWDFSRARFYIFLASICLGIMYVYSPFNGEYFDYVRRVHTAYFWSTYLSLTFVRTSSMLFLPIWIYCTWWWVSMLRDLFRSSSPTA